MILALALTCGTVVQVVGLTYEVQRQLANLW
jgi:hypothetical protein